ncbi:MAG: alpha/beta hydrolase family protein [Phycisphaeraceae bacterium]
MAKLEIRYSSEVLGMSRTLHALVPEHREVPAGGFPVLWLLHGLYGDDSDWTRYGRAEFHVQELPLVVVMPSTDRAWYTDMSAGYRYWTHLSEELPGVVGRMLPVTERREHTFVAGLSMGGYGSFKWALRSPERFAAAGSFSGALGRAGQMDHGDRATEWMQEQGHIFGDLERFAGGEDDTEALARRLAGSDGVRPELFQACGTADFLYQQNLRFRDTAREVGLGLTYEEHEGEDHTWPYWDRMLGYFLAWLDVPGRL